MKKALTETQTLRDGCSKAEPKMFAPPQTPQTKKIKQTHKQTHRQNRLQYTAPQLARRVISQGLQTWYHSIR